MPTVSVVIPTYNRADYVTHAARSALEQDVPGGVEVIVVDDGSTDNTAAVVASLDPKVQYVRQENRREGAARNNGAARARGAYFAFLDSDDYYLPGKLAGDVARLDAPDRPALVYSRALNVDPEDRVLGARRLPTPQGDVFWHLARENFIPMSTVAVRADCFRACGGFGEELALSGTADWAMWMRMAARWPVGFVEQTATAIRVHPRNMLSDTAWMERGNLTALGVVLRDTVAARRTDGRASVVRSHMYVTNALSAYANGRRGRALVWLARALLVWPGQALDPRFLGAAGRTALGQGGVRVVRRARQQARPQPVRSATASRRTRRR